MIALKKNLIFLCDKLSNIFDKEYITLVIKKIYEEAYSNIIKGILYFNIYYLKIDKFLEEEDIIKNIENYDISYGEDSFKIINDGILLKYKKVPY